MSGDWIKMRGNLWDDPRVSALVDATDSSEAAVVGALYWLWASADQHSEDGVMPGLSVRQIDRKTGVPGFAAALETIGWIEVLDAGIRIVRERRGEPLFIVGVDRPRLGASAWIRLRFAVFKRDGHRCVYCGSTERIECDHVVPVARGGRNTFDNLVAACFGCNRSKGQKTVAEWQGLRA